MTLWIVLAVVLLVIFAVLSRRAKQRAAVSGLRRHFPRIARLRLVALCPALENTLTEADLRLLFDWMLIEMYRRTGSSGFGELMRWSVVNGWVESTVLTNAVAQEAVDRLPRPALAIIDACQGRTVAGTLIEQALSEAGEHISPELERKYV